MTELIILNVNKSFVIFSSKSYDDFSSVTVLFSLIQLTSCVFIFCKIFYCLIVDRLLWYNYKHKNSGIFFITFFIYFHLFCISLQCILFFFFDKFLYEIWLVFSSSFSKSFLKVYFNVSTVWWYLFIYLLYLLIVEQKFKFLFKSFNS